MPQTTPPKDVIYIDVDDEITAVIDKLQQSNSKIVALVLPKRAAVFQSVVNMRLLKRSADNAKKNIVLITSEAGLLPLAGVAGLHVAKTPQSKPTIPDAPAAIQASDVIEDATSGTEVQPDASVTPPDDDVIEVDNDSLETPVVTKQSFNKKLRVPNFDSFRTRLVIGSVALVLLIVGWVFATMILPKSTVLVKTDITEVAANVIVTTGPSITALDEASNFVPGLLKEHKKTDTQKAPATGKKDVGTKASGDVTLSLTDCSKEQVTVPAGTTVSAGIFNFVTQVDVSMQSVKIGPNCRNSDFKDISTAKVKVVAQNAGDSYNLSSRNYTVSGFSNVSGAGSAMSGGTSKVITVVSQQDIDSLKQKVVDSLSATANQEVTAQLKDAGYFPLTDTFAAKDPLAVPSPAADSEAGEVTVTVTAIYTMLGAKQEDVVKVLEANIKSQIDITKQNILDNGLGAASIRIEERQPSDITRFTLQTTAKAGVEQNEQVIKAAIAGKKKGEVKTIIGSRPGVRDVTVTTSPFWVSKVPSKQSKITVIFEQQKQ